MPLSIGLVSLSSPPRTVVIVVSIRALVNDVVASLRPWIQERTYDGGQGSLNALPLASPVVLLSGFTNSQLRGVALR